MEKAFDRLEWSFITIDLSFLNSLIILLILLWLVLVLLLFLLLLMDSLHPFSTLVKVLKKEIHSLLIFSFFAWNIYLFLSLKQFVIKVGPYNNFKERTTDFSPFFFSDDIILFEKTDATSIMTKILTLFSNLSGYKISLTKFRIFCSPNTNANLKIALLALFNISITGHLGSYLGFPLSST